MSEQRRCQQCGLLLSRYNMTPLCAPCGESATPSRCVPIDPEHLAVAQTRAGCMCGADPVIAALLLALDDRHEPD